MRYQSRRTKYLLVCTIFQLVQSRNTIFVSWNLLCLFVCLFFNYVAVLLYLCRDWSRHCVDSCCFSMVYRIDLPDFFEKNVDKWTGEAVVQEKGCVDYNIGNTPKITNWKPIDQPQVSVAHFYKELSHIIAIWKLKWVGGC